MAAFWGMIFLSMADDSIFYPILWIMLIISLFVSVMALWKWKVGVRAGAEPGAAIHGGGRWGPGPSPGLGWGPCLGGEAVSQRGLARLGLASWGRQGPGLCPGLVGTAVAAGDAPSHSLLSVPIQKERQRKCQHRGNHENSRGEQPWATALQRHPLAPHVHHSITCSPSTHFVSFASSLGLPHVFTALEDAVSKIVPSWNTAALSSHLPPNEIPLTLLSALLQLLSAQENG